jgi:hypothetical protein
MSRGQLWLLPPPKPLVERFGEEFFRQLPATPGVYLFCGSHEGVLYVGKARNLKKRLASYRVANPERFPRRIIRLLHQVTRIEWDECPNDEAAVFREELLITVLQPKFNRAGVVWVRSVTAPRLNAAIAGQNNGTLPGYRSETRNPVARLQASV